MSSSEDELPADIKDLIEKLGIFKFEEVNSSEEMNAEQVQALLQSAISQATERTKADFQSIVDQLTGRLAALETPIQVEEYKPIQVINGVECTESLDIVKSVPEFNGDSKKYVSWRQSAITAHDLFKRFEGSTRYYQTVAILRNKIVGSADSVLSAYNTVLNFKAIIARLDFAYADKKSIYTLEQELSTLKQGAKSLIEFYDLIEQKLTLIINKVLMTNEGNRPLIDSLNDKYRKDALRVFISGLRRPLCDILFSCKPADMPSALALAQELETNQNRYHFASIYNDGLQNRQHANQPGTSNSPHYRVRPLANSAERQAPLPSQVPQQQQLRTPSAQVQQTTPNRPEPMDVDRSIRSMQRSIQNRAAQNQYQATKRPLDPSFKENPNKMQKINYLPDTDCFNAEEENLCESFDFEPPTFDGYELAPEYFQEDFNNIQTADEINFLGGNSLLPYVEKTLDGKEIKLLIDTGASKNYAKNLAVLKSIESVNEPFNVKSFHGNSKVTHKCLINVFNKNCWFFILPDLETFDGIIGLDFLNEINAQIDLQQGVLRFDGGEEKLKYLPCKQVKNITLKRNISLEGSFAEIFEKDKKVFAGQNPIPSYPGEMLHIDLFSTNSHHFLSCIDKFTKFVSMFPIASRSIADIKTPLLTITNFFPNAKTIICDNEKSFNSQTIKSLMENNFKIKILAVPPAHGTSNGQMEKLHSTIAEISRCYKNQNICNDTNDLILLSVPKYNNTVHSTTGFKPAEIIHCLSDIDRNAIKGKLLQTQCNDLSLHNRKRPNKSFKPGVGYAKFNKRLGNKFSKLYVKKKRFKRIWGLHSNR